ncbi:MAG TPA: ABC transporter permease [Vicinamibacterales bacterium]|nr:ABC transporter permease [Vicinamibacterales bacterium]
MGRTPSLHRALSIVRYASRLVPARLREEWRREWEGELSAAAEHPKVPIVRHALGAFFDAFWIRQRDVADLQTIDDLRHGLRQWRQQAGFAITAIGILALSMAASVTAFSVVSQILLRPLPYQEPERIVTLFERQSSTPGRRDVAPGNFLDWRARATSFTKLAGLEPYSFDYTGGDRPEVLKAVLVTEGFFDTFGIQPLAGRFFRPEEHAKGNNRVVVITERFWRSHFNGDPGIVGKSIPLDDGPFVVAGVVANDFQPHFQEEASGDRDLYAAKAVEDYESKIRASSYWNVVGRLKDGVSIEHAQAEMDAISAVIERDNPSSNTGVRAEVITLREHLVGDVRPAVRLFGAAVIAVLLIACVNVTNLLLARGSLRRQELTVRSALGASRSRLAGQLLVETLLLASTAAAFALALGHAAMRGLATWGPREVMWIDSLHVDGVAVAFAIALAFAVTVAAGLVPALRLSGIGLQAPGPRTMTGDRSQRHLRSVLVIAEVAMALMLISGTGLLLRSFVNLAGVDTGFSRDNVMVIQMFAWDRNHGPVALRSYLDRISAKVSSIPGVQQVGAVQAMPFIESNIDTQGQMRLVDQPPPKPGDEIRASYNVVSPNYFPVMGTRSLKGRLLDDRDGANAPRVAAISEAFAAKYLPGIDPIGQRLEIRIQGRPQQFTIVGVVPSLRHERLDAAARAEVLLPFAQAPTGSITLVARTSVDPAMLIDTAKREIWTIDPMQTFYRTATLEELVDRTLVTRRFALIVLTGFAALALLLAAAGLYGVLSTIASQYRKEIGVRMALGAAWLDILQLVARRGLMVSAIGVAVGLVGVLGGARVLRGFLFSVTPTDPIAIGGAAILMLTIAAIACYIPARRAAGENPVQALRVD